MSHSRASDSLCSSTGGSGGNTLPPGHLSSRTNYTQISSYTDPYSVDVIQRSRSLRLTFTLSPLVLLHIRPTSITLTWPSSFISTPHSSHVSPYVCVRTVLPLPPFLSHYVHNTNGDVTINLSQCADTLPQLGPAASLSLSLSAFLSLSVCVSLSPSQLWIESWLREDFWFGVWFPVWLVWWH